MTRRLSQIDYWSNTLADTFADLGDDVAAVEARPRGFAQGYANGHRKVILTVPQAAQYLGLAPKTLRGLARRGVIPAARVGKHWRFVREQLDTHIAAKALENLQPCPSTNVPAPHIGRRGSGSLGARLDAALTQQSEPPLRNSRSSFAVVTGGKSS